jgi:stage III sporulation protein AF
MDAIREWAKSIGMVLFFSIVADLLMPEGGMKKYARLVLGVFVVLAVIEPISRIAGGSISLPLPPPDTGASDYRPSSEEQEKRSIEMISRVVESGLAERLASIQGVGDASVKVEVRRDVSSKKWIIDHVSVTVSPEVDEGENMMTNDDLISPVKVTVPPISDRSEEQEKVLDESAGSKEPKDNSFLPEDGDLQQNILSEVTRALGVVPETVEVHVNPNREGR